MANKDGWHIVYGQNVYVENGKVVLGTTKDENNSEVTCYPYEYNKEHDCWVNISREVTLTAYRAGYKKGTKCMKWTIGGNFPPFGTGSEKLEGDPSFFVLL